MRILEVRERAVPLSRYRDPALRSGGLTTSAVAVVTGAERDGRPVVGYGFASFGRYAQSGLIRERFAPRLLEAEIGDGEGGIDPSRAWEAMMRGEKPGGHGERCVAIGALDLAVWDAGAKLAGLPLYRYLARRLGTRAGDGGVRVYAGGGYYYPGDDLARLRDEIRSFLAAGHTHVKIKIGGAPLERDLARIEAALALLPGPRHLAVDAMNAYDAAEASRAARALRPYGLWWFEDVCDPHDFETLASVAAEYEPALAAGEALFSESEARLLDRYGGLRRDRDVLLFDPVHCYGVSGFARIVGAMERCGWPRTAFWPHGGHPATAHVALALGLGGAETNPSSFAPFGGLDERASLANGRALLPDLPGAGLERAPGARAFFDALLR